MTSTQQGGVTTCKYSIVGKSLLLAPRGPSIDWVDGKVMSVLLVSSVVENRHHFLGNSKYLWIVPHNGATALQDLASRLCFALICTSTPRKENGNKNRKQELCSRGKCPTYKNLSFFKIPWNILIFVGVFIFQAKLAS